MEIDNFLKTKVLWKRHLFEKFFLKSVNPFYLAVPHHSQSYCLFVLYIQMLTIFGTASKRKEIILVIFAAGNVKNNDELFLLQLLIHMNSGKSFSMFIRTKKREENNEEIVEKLFQNKGFFVVCVKKYQVEYLEAI